MKKEMIQLTKGNMEIYDFGVLRLHAYQTNDLLNDECYLLENETEVLCMASVFHDSRRQDDWYDVGHGQRAAEYYREYCRQSEIREGTV